MSHVQGVGGAFVFARDLEKLAGWYRDVLGFEFEGGEEFGAYYKIFWALAADGSGRRVDTTFAVMRAKREFPSWAEARDEDDMYGDQPFMVNLRVDDLDATLADLRAKDVAVLKESDEGYAKFAWIRDAEGNRIELYEPRAEEASDGDPAGGADSE
ncbi:MAG: VOC family protein [Acidobacteria bacterium]|nr:MAG: VOC family protein [Acidobacteriota bacterium]REK11108.1 MAG: VOC family protein [Acidobacteriota bacterium]